MKPYTPPVLTLLGKVERITQTTVQTKGRGTRIDGQGCYAKVAVTGHYSGHHGGHGHH